jgi:Xaa-Pro aminopeptidase
MEQAGARAAHISDAIGMIKFLYWLEQQKSHSITEQKAADQLEVFRRMNPFCRGLSFNTISGFSSHGAIIHYAVKPQSDRIIDDSSIYLIDSGGQYYGIQGGEYCGGTTDITRTIHLGTPTVEQKHHYTLVLKGHLALRHAIFPQGTCGEQLDVLARQYLWQESLDYGHGTGHGVGSYLCVHEGPQRISPYPTGVPLLPGMIVSNEPGFYLENQYGIRIENLCLVVPHTMNNKLNSRPFYRFEDLTLVPYARSLINFEELTEQEKQWVDDYHHLIFKTVSERLDDKDLREWLAQVTRPLE